MRKVPTKGLIRIGSVLILCMITIFSLDAQKSRTDLEKQRRALLKEIEAARSILSQTQTEKRKSLSYLNGLNARIRLRKNLLKTLNSEVDQLSSEIGKREDNIVQLRSDLSVLKENFKQMLQDGYKMRDKRDRLELLFSSSNINEFMRRNRYLKAVIEFRKQQFEAILRTQEEEKEEINRLVENRTEKLMLLQVQEDEEAELVRDKEESESLVKSLKGREKELQQEIKKKQQIADELEKAIKKAIEEEIRKAREEEERRRKEELERRKRDSKKKEETVLPAATEALSTEFNSNKGGLPWPVSNGYITEHFGVHQHSEFKNVKTENNGINISTTKGSTAKAIFSGTVSAILEVPGRHKTVLVKHGSYFTVYSNLSTVNVEKGDELKVGDAIGVVHTDNSGLTELHFEVWDKSEKQDPEAWLRKQGV